MSKIQLVQQAAAPVAPSSGKVALYVDNGTVPALNLLLPDGSTYKPFSDINEQVFNNNTSDVVATGADTHLTGSALMIPSGHRVQVGTLFRWHLEASKTAAGTATGQFNVRVGTLGTVGDTGVALFNFTAAQSATVDSMAVTIDAVVRSIGAAAVLQCVLEAESPKSGALGFWTILAPQMPATSATNTFDSTVDSLYFSISANPGASGVWTFQMVKGEVLNIL